MKTALSIAGSDCSGGAGIQADIKTMLANGVYGMTAVTALVAENTVAVREIFSITPAFLASQISCVFEDIRPDAVKVGMLPTPALAEVTADALLENRAAHIVLDPVMVATSGGSLTETETVGVMRERLFPLAEVITPNIPEAEILTGLHISGRADMERAASLLQCRYGCAVLLKGGHQCEDAADLLCLDGRLIWFEGRRIPTANTHGTGCTLSSAIAANLAKGFSLTTSVNRAKSYTSGALGAGLDLGRGQGPMHHGFAVTGRFAEEAQ